MGQSTDAILVFGVHVPDSEDLRYSELSFAAEGDEEFEDTICRLAGASDRSYTERNAIAEAHPLTVVSHCSGDYPMWIVGLRSTLLRASRGYPVDFSNLPEVNHFHVAALREFMTEHGIDGTPTWILCSDWN